MSTFTLSRDKPCRAGVVCFAYMQNAGECYKLGLQEVHQFCSVYVVEFSSASFNSGNFHSIMGFKNSPPWLMTSKIRILSNRRAAEQTLFCLGSI